MTVTKSMNYRTLSCPPEAKERRLCKRKVGWGTLGKGRKTEPLRGEGRQPAEPEKTGLGVLGALPEPPGACGLAGSLTSPFWPPGWLENPSHSPGS